MWADLTNISDLVYRDQSGSGVYLWGFSINNNFVPYYFGITDNISYRIHQHINSIIGGRYTVFHRDSLANFKEYKDKEVQADKSKGKIYSPDWVSGYKHFIDNRKNLQPHIDFMVDSFTFSFATIDKKVISGADLKEIEKICFNQIGIENLINTRTGTPIKTTITHSGNELISNKFNKKTV